ncbi:hypothetical protein M9H77_30246 [Catharanthus roseus]|uniref:Uncharacterized protein n=1 Tax=Catharanthus roseus TaxID=4058 RepID=A0ACB9ZXJ2_CATRO|nr:hypothetical protein M9H77_30246 [Catharanthus roseus]
MSFRPHPTLSTVCTYSVGSSKGQGWSAFISSPLFTTGSLEISRFRLDSDLATSVELALKKVLVQDVYKESSLNQWLYLVSIDETHPLVVQEPNEVHGWFLSVRASEALSHQSFAIPPSLKAVNVTLMASSYLGVS